MCIGISLSEVDFVRAVCFFSAAEIKTVVLFNLCRDENMSACLCGLYECDSGEVDEVI